MNKWRRILYHPNQPLGDNGKRVTACAEHTLSKKTRQKREWCC